MIIRQETFGDWLRTGTGTLTVEQISGNRFAVVRRLPCGMDIAPEVFGRFDSLDDANQCFDAKRESVAALFRF